MSEFNSPLGRRALAAKATGPQVFTVPDEEGYREEYRAASADDIRNFTQASTKGFAPPKGSLEESKQIQNTRREMIEAKKRISPAAKERIEILTGLGRLRKDVVFEGVTFSIQSLKSGELKEVMAISDNSDSDSKTERFFIARNSVLARSIYMIDGQPLGIVLGDDSIDAKSALIDDMDESAVSFIHSEYLAMVDKDKKKFAVENAADAEEVVAEVKK